MVDWVVSCHLMKIAATTPIYTHVLNKGGRGVKSPLDSGDGSPPMAREPAAAYSVMRLQSRLSAGCRLTLP